MKRWEYIALACIAIGVISISSLFTSQPVNQFLIDGFLSAGETFVTMVWITWWALVLGFSVAGGVEAWVSSERISNAFEGASPKDITVASIFGFISSSCSYSAIATAKNIFNILEVGSPFSTSEWVGEETDKFTVQLSKKQV